MEMHLAGKKHKRKLELSGNNAAQADVHPELLFGCDVCGVKAPDQNCLEMHLRGKKHLKKVAAMPTAGERP